MTGFSGRQTKVLTCAAICVALSLAMQQVGAVYRFPQGGSVTLFGMFFVALAGYYFGPVVGLIVGAVTGSLDLLLGGYVVHPIQLLLDYPVAYGLLGGLAGLFFKLKYGLQIGYIVGVLGRYISHTVSGVVFFAEYAPEGQNYVIYSMGYNIGFIWPEAVLTLIIVSIPAFSKVISHVRERLH